MASEVVVGCLEHEVPMSGGPNETCDNESTQAFLRTISIAGFGREGPMANKCRDDESAPT